MRFRYVERRLVDDVITIVDHMKDEHITKGVRQCF